MYGSFEVNVLVTGRRYLARSRQRASFVLALGATGNPVAQVVPMLIVDSLLVGYLGTLKVTLSFVIAARATGSAGIELAPTEAGAPDPSGPLLAR